MKLWVMEGPGVLSDGGLVCVLAETEEQAWTLLKQENCTAWWVLRGGPEDRDDPRPIDRLPRRFRCVEDPEAFVRWGEVKVIGWTAFTAKLLSI